MDLRAAPEGVNVPDELRRLVAAAVLGDEPVSVLEAGCGSASQLDLGPRAVITGIDLSSRQLERNAALAVRIKGDLQTHRFESGSFDVVVCWNVLEHLERPAPALDNMVDALRPGGLLVLAVPNAYSLKGWLARLTPHAFHVWVYRRLFNLRDAGTDDRGPFRTHFAAPVTPAGLRGYASRSGLEVVVWCWHEDYGQRVLRERLRIPEQAWRRASGSVRRLSRQRIDPDRTDFFFALRKSGQSSTRHHSSKTSSDQT